MGFSALLQPATCCGAFGASSLFGRALRQPAPLFTTNLDKKFSGKWLNFPLEDEIELMWSSNINLVSGLRLSLDVLFRFSVDCSIKDLNVKNLCERI